jgi:TPR repeat protein
MYEIGCGVEKDLQQAVDFYRKAAEMDFPPAQYNMGSVYEQGAGVKKVIKKAIIWYQKAAEHNHPQAKDALKRLKASQ